MNITVVVTTYNALDHLKRLLLELKTQGFDDIVVLDDASSDETAAWLRDQESLRYVIGESNLGPTGNRNHMLELESRELILFLDVDMTFVSSNAAQTIESVMAEHADVAVLSALILSQNDEPMWYNWGYEMSPRLDGLTEALNGIALAHWDDAAMLATVRQLAEGRIGHFETPRDRNVDWTTEAFFVVRRDSFDQLGGFDPAFRMFHEGQDYCLRARKAGYTCRITTQITLKHLDLASGTSEQRQADLRASTKYYYRKHYQVPSELLERFFLS